MPSSVHSRALRKAAELAGGLDKLARRLRVKSPELLDWMNGKAEVPTDVFLKTVDLLLDEMPVPPGSDPGDPPSPRESAGDSSQSGTWHC